MNADLRQALIDQAKIILHCPLCCQELMIGERGVVCTTCQIGTAYPYGDDWFAVGYGMAH